MKKATIKNRIKLWWHCLTHFHQICILTIAEDFDEINKGRYIGCRQCDKGFQKILDFSLDLLKENKKK